MEKPRRTRVGTIDGWGHLTEHREHDFEKAQAERNERTRELAQRLTAASGDKELVRQLDDRLRAQSALGSTRGHPGPFVWALVAARPSLGAAIAEAVATDPASQLLDVVSVALAALVEHEHAGAMPAITRLLDSGHLDVRRQVAQALGWNRGARADAPRR